jgi:hypothetical protein
VTRGAEDAGHRAETKEIAMSISNPDQTPIDPDTGQPSQPDLDMPPAEPQRDGAAATDVETPGSTDAQDRPADNPSGG